MVVLLGTGAFGRPMLRHGQRCAESFRDARDGVLVAGLMGLLGDGDPTSVRGCEANPRRFVAVAEPASCTGFCGGDFETAFETTESAEPRNPSNDREAFRIRPFLRRSATQGREGGGVHDRFINSAGEPGCRGEASPHHGSYSGQLSLYQRRTTEGWSWRSFRFKSSSRRHSCRRSFSSAAPASIADVSRPRLSKLPTRR